MQKERTHSGILGAWQRLLDAMSANTTDLPHLEASRQLLVDHLDQTQALLRRQAAQTAEKQQSSQDLRARISDGQRMATMLRQGIKQHFGIRSEKLAEFGLATYRGRAARTKPENPTPPPTTE
ncbi:MAG: hypothetical protein ABUT39_29835 [Acidobacteriota bacterium]